MKYPSIKTKRFDIHSHEIVRDESLGGQPRVVFQAWHHSEDVAYPVCTVTVWIVENGWSDFNYIEWISVEEGHRRKGIATEVLSAIEKEVGLVEMDGVTESGEAFVESYERSRC